MLVDVFGKLSDTMIFNGPSVMPEYLTDVNVVWCPSWNGGGNVIYRLREGIERFMITDINNPASSAGSQSAIPVMWDHLTPQIKGSCHVPAGMNVLYMDGHVRFEKYLGADSPWMITIDGPRIMGRYDREFR
jgi:prepilin-type processing-associated H-X9-DG protein